MLRSISNALTQIDWMMFASVLVLLSFSLVMLHSLAIDPPAVGDFPDLSKQALFILIGVLLFFVLAFFDYRVFQTNSYFVLTLYLFSVALLVGLFFFAPDIRGTRSWYRVGALSFDPFEFTKIVLILLLAKYFSWRHVDVYQHRHIIISGLYVLSPTLLVLLQPNMGSGLLLVALWLGVLAVSGIKLRQVFVLVLTFTLLSLLSWSYFLQDYQKERIISFVAPQEEPLGAGWQQRQARIALGSGGLFGQGLGEGSQVQYGFLPEAHTDFIFSAIGEELGLVGILVLLAAIGVLMLRIIRIALSTSSNFARFYVAGYLVVLVSQVVVNIGMNLGLLPIVGLGLPFVSYGGSGLIANFIALGIVQNIALHRSGEEVSTANV